MNKWMRHLPSLPTGLKAWHIFFLIIGTILQGCCLFCWDKEPDERYKITFFNSTEFDLRIVLGEETIKDEYNLRPQKASSQSGSIGVNDGEDPVVKIFDGGYAPYQNIVKVYRNDSLRVTWHGPPRDFGNDSLSFFNFRSWEVIKYPEDSLVDGEIRFTIDTIY
ncbi:hypothetical protein QWY31_01485 [Cytophagales bacterium LB-30]|uniref:Uncharacterized protein n=1 Tax=Shiella aurantiaca TaxID=3058365 RepID=A0ABT8F1C3_9BACT|nr:hypothetical protein [Shiella aurantiaca]MDN4164149.1 hypothetical protein [Shiella aurantiaca]